jgi:hypothetical protein
MYSSDVGQTRADAAPVPVQALAKGGKQLDPSLGERAKQGIPTALQDPEDAVRSPYDSKLSKFGGQDYDPCTQTKRVAETDPPPRSMVISIRKRAEQAIEAIQKRAGQSKNLKVPLQEIPRSSF